MIDIRYFLDRQKTAQKTAVESTQQKASAGVFARSASDFCPGRTKVSGVSRRTSSQRAGL